jgi:drug/metabolite transporter (DMT)-like permease
LAVILFGILAVSTASIFIRYAQRDAPSLVIAAYRLTIASLALAPVAVGTRRAELRRLSRRDAGLALLSGAFLAVHFATWISSLEYTTIASSVVLVSTTPLWVALVSPALLKERLSRPVIVGLLLTLIGVTVVGLSDTCGWGGSGLQCPPLAEFVRGRAFFGDMLAITGAMAGAAYLVIGRSLRARVSLIGYVFVVYSMAAVVLIGFALTARQPLLGYPASAYLWFALLALVPQLLGHSSFNWALGYLPAAFVSLTLLGEPIGSTILAYFILGETPSMMKVVGAILILLGIYIASTGQEAG